MGLVGFAQDSSAFFGDSLKKRLAGAQTTADKVHFLMDLATTAPDSMQAEVYAREAVTDAELSRDRRLMATTYLRNGERYLNIQGLEGNLEKAQHCFELAEQGAKEDGLLRLLTESYAGLSRMWRIKGDNEKALSFSNLAMATAVNTDNDSAKVTAYATMGDVYRDMKNMPMAFEHYSEALSLAEESRDGRLLRRVYLGLSYFYGAMLEYGKAIDEMMQAYEVDRRLWDGSNMLMDLNRLGELFGNNKQHDLALQVYEHSLALADTLHYDLLKITSYFRIFNLYYFQTREYVKALHYLLGQRVLFDYLLHFGYGFYLMQIKAVAFTEEGRYDSAMYYFRLAEPLVSERGNIEVKAGFCQSFGDYYIKRRQYPEAIGYYRKAFDLVAAEKDLDNEQGFADSLQRLYEQVGDYRSALVYNRLASAEGDSLRAKTQETELMKLEVETENRRKERQARDEELNKERRHNIQYMGFTAGLVLLFITIVMLGRLPVSVGVIRTVVFLSFIFLFEFIILLLDRTIQAWTHEEPWKVLCIKIVLAAGLVPLHHWLEHRVIHYISHRRGRGSHASGAEGVVAAVTEGTQTMQGTHKI
ncbi:hypothetical protein GCM10011511_44410 [Puia dinghuensis]|uniref:Tetratricopeptide repeat protein n=2 Tax=Puia dinghuensis TaxID=1792502 RepID=A0A8J2UH97_9BACT|nr:hypothetical protein GCM10011511_44410 [Puia dinghuensis]